MSKKKSLMTMKEYAAYRGVSYGLIARHVKKGNITKVDGKIDPEKADKELNSKIDAQFAHKSKLKTDISNDVSGHLSYNLAKAKRESFKADMAELEFKVKQGKLIDVEQMEKEAEDLYRRYRDRMLNVVIRASKKLLGETNEFKFRQVLKSEIENAIKKIK
jgi:flagellar biosynthesis/type III secretory pathway protein FliH